MGKDIIQIKGTMHGLIITMDGNHDFSEIKDNLRRKIESSKGFFNGAKFTFRINNSLIAENNTEELTAFCVSQGLIYDPEIPFPVRQRNLLPTNNDEKKSESNIQGNLSPTVSEDDKKSATNVGVEQQIISRGLTQAELEQETLMVKQNLRSGQRIIYPGNVVVLGDVNAGAYIIAGGNIIIMGTLRGTAHAGASGDTNSSIIAYNLKPTQIRIAEHIGRAPDNDMPLLFNYPEAAKINAGQIVIEQLNSSRNNLISRQ